MHQQCCRVQYRILCPDKTVFSILYFFLLRSRWKYVIIYWFYEEILCAAVTVRNNQSNIMILLMIRQSQQSSKIEICCKRIMQLLKKKITVSLLYIFFQLNVLFCFNVYNRSLLLSEFFSPKLCGKF
jgi:hypothetical protein